MTIWGGAPSEGPEPELGSGSDTEKLGLGHLQESERVNEGGDHLQGRCSRKGLGGWGGGVVLACLRGRIISTV